MPEPLYFKIENPAGRLIAARVYTLPSRREGRLYRDQFTALCQRLPDRVVICADYRPIAIFSPEVAEELLALMSGINPAVDRAALLTAPEHATHSLQTARLARESGHPLRRRFTSPTEARAWLGEILNAPEAHALHAFLDEIAP